jgi:type IV pilus assembly protein PilB
MVQMGIDPFLVASSVVLVAAQRLARKLCPACRKRTEVDPAKLAELGFSAAEIEQATVFQAQGCGRCNQGYKGRFALLETLEMLDNVRGTVLANGNEMDIKRSAMANGMITLRRAAIRNVVRGATSIEEMLRITAADERVARSTDAAAEDG